VVHRIVVNAALMKLRTRRRRPERVYRRSPPYFPGRRTSGESGASLERNIRVALQRHETCSLVRECIDAYLKLPNVLLLRDIEELDTEETAQLLDLTPNAVKIRLHRARQALRTLLDPYFREDPA